MLSEDCASGFKKYQKEPKGKVALAYAIEIPSSFIGDTLLLPRTAYRGLLRRWSDPTEDNVDADFDPVESLVRRQIPLGMPISEAETVMKAHGYQKVCQDKSCEGEAEQVTFSNSQQPRATRDQAASCAGEGWVTFEIEDGKVKGWYFTRGTIMP